MCTTGKDHDQSDGQLLQSVTGGTDLQSVTQITDLLTAVAGLTDVEEHDALLAEVVSRLLQLGNTEQAYRVAHELLIPAERVSALLSIIRSPTHHESNKSLFDSLTREVQDAVHYMEEDWQRADSLCELAQLYALWGERDLARQIFMEAVSFARHGEETGDIQTAVDCSKALKQITKVLVALAEMNFARDVASSIKNDYIRHQALAFLT
jgi:hypothetical protein